MIKIFSVLADLTDDAVRIPRTDRSTSQKNQKTRRRFSLSLFKKPSDHEYVNSIRKFERVRRSLATLFVGCGIIALTMGIRLGQDLSKEAHVLAVTTPVAEARSMAASTPGSGALLYDLGLKVGAISSGLIFASTGLIILGVALGLGGRRQKILVEAFDHMEGRAVPAAPSTAPPLNP
jgi:hypothetical protein